MRFEVTPQGFKQDGKPFFLISGEMHYFRVKKKDWPRHLEKMKKVHLDTVTTYIPWSWHEAKEGIFDLEGKTKPEKDIVGFIDLCHENGLKVVVKPGPYILAEYQDQGIPRWLLARHPEIQVEDSQGRINMPFVCSFMHPIFLEYAAKWFDQIIPAIAQRQSSKNGPISMLQICNEVGLQHWLAGCGDYNPVTLKYYDQFLEGKYRSINILNQLYSKNYSSFDQVIPPSGNTECPQDIARYRDWHTFHREYYYIYLKYLMDDLKIRGITVPFYENVPGWVYGRANEFPVCITLYSEVVAKCPDLLLGLDHIPENVDFRNFHDAAVISEMTRSLQNRSMPLYSAEFQAGSREHCVRTYPNELELFYKAALSYGTQGWNYYMFSQGKNPPGEGVYGPMFYWDTPLDVKGKENPLYDVVSRINGWIRANEENFLPSKKHSSVGVAFYKPYYETEFFYPLFLKDKYFRPEKVGLTYDFKWVRDAFYFDGLIKVLYALNFNPELPDLEVQSVDELLEYKQLWVLAIELMDPKTQEKLLDFVRRGGRAIFYPSLPKFDLEGRPCDILKKGLGIEGDSIFCPTESKVQFFDHELVNSFPVMTVFNGDDASVVAKVGNKVCGFEKNIGKGRAIILGTLPNYQIAEHMDVFKAFLERDGLLPQVVSNDPNVNFQIRKGPHGSFLFVLNFHPIEKEIVIDLLIDGKKMKLPSQRRLVIGPTSGLILPFDWELSQGIKIIYATSELVGQAIEGSRVKLQMRGPQGTRGEIVLQLEKAPQRVLVNGKEVEFKKTEEGFLVQYRHGAKEISLEVVG
ncbi:MAG: beta-galactosidase [Chlamydiae bacterium]|nr:beta-galactosidase [Chlamydiota bacterium]MBI3276396.1 beta-galactosidase [Chlamydiota bacterium]